MSPAGHKLKNKGHSVVLKPPCISSMDINERWSSINKSESEGKVTQLCPTLCDPLDYTVHGILQARILEWVAFPIFRGSS